MKPRKSRQTLGNVFSTTFRRVAVSTLIPLLFISCCLFALQYGQYVRRLGDANLTTLSKEDQIVTVLLENLDNSMENLVKDPTVVNFVIQPHLKNSQRNSNLCAMLENLSKTYPFILEATLLSHFQQLQLSSGGILHYGITQDWTECIAQGKLLSGGMGLWIMKRGATHEMYLYRNVPFGSIGGLATVYLRIDLEAFLEEVTGSDRESALTGKMLVRRTDGDVLFSSDPDSQQQLASMLDAVEDTAYHTELKLLGRTPYVCSAVTNEELQWTFLFATPLLPATGSLLSVGLPILLCILAACGIGLLLAWRGSKELYRPLEQLVAAIPEPTDSADGAQNEYARLAVYYDELLSHKDEVYEQLQAIKPILRERFLISLIQDKPPTPSELQYQMNVLELPLLETRFCAIMLQIDRYYDLGYSAAEKRDIKEQLRALLAACDHETLSCVTAEVSDETILALCSDQLGDSDENAAWNVRILAEHLQREAEKSWGISLTVGIGGVCHELAELPTTCQEAKRAMTYKLYRGPGCLIDFSEVEGADTHCYPISFQQMQLLLNTVRAGDEKNTQQLLLRMFRSFSDAEKFSPERLRDLLRSLLSALSELIQATPGLQEEMPTEDLENILARKKTLADIETWLTELYCRTATVVKIAHSSHMRTNAEKIKQYIDENRTKDISLSSISEFMGYSPTYVSRIFRQQYGVSYIDYLNSSRVSLAKELLTTTELSVKEIGFQVGFNNLQTYFRIFKKYTSITPLQFRESTPKEAGRTE